MLRTPTDNEPPGLWLQRALVDHRQRLTSDLVRSSLGNEAKHAFSFDGVDLLVSFLTSWSERSARTRTFVIAGVTELVDNLGKPPGEQQSGAKDRLAAMAAAESEAEPQTPASLQDAVDAAKRFFLLARASLERANFGGPARAADIACFETFRLAAIAADVNTEAGKGERELLAHITSWHQTALDQTALDQTASRDARAELPNAMLNGVELLSTQIDSFAHHSLVLRITAANSTVEQLLINCATDLMSATVRLDGVDPEEQSALKLITDLDHELAEPELADGLAMIAKSMFIIPRGRGGHLAPDPEFDRLWALYRRAVPWTTADRRP